MDLKITSEKIANPLLVELLKKLTDSFNRMGREFYVIGATARDIIIRQLIDTTSGRRTKDLDIAIAIPDWSVFDEIKDVLVADGFKKSVDMRQRFYYGEYELDIVPYGVAKDDDNIYWPPEEEIAMSVKGFDEVLSEAITVNIDGEFDIRIASLHGLFLLKFNAWLDRTSKRVKMRKTCRLFYPIISWPILTVMFIRKFMIGKILMNILSEDIGLPVICSCF